VEARTHATCMGFRYVVTPANDYWINIKCGQGGQLLDKCQKCGQEGGQLLDKGQKCGEGGGACARTCFLHLKSLFGDIDRHP
jgi:hypothetical protein